MKITPTNQWTYSCDSDFWYEDFYSTKQEAIEAGLEEYPNGCYVGSCSSMKFTYDDMDFSEYVIERLGEFIDEEVCDDEAQVWYDKITWDDEKLLEDYLAKAVMKWIEDCQLQPSQYVVNDIEWIEKFPNAPKDSLGNPIVCPQDLGYGDFCCDDTNHNCTECWSRPLEE